MLQSVSRNRVFPHFRSVICLSWLKTMDFVINSTKCVLFYLIKSARLLTLDEFFFLTLFPFPSACLPSLPPKRANQLTDSPLDHHWKWARKEERASTGAQDMVQIRPGERDKWMKRLLNRQPSRFSFSNGLQCVFNSSHSVWICIHLRKRGWIAQCS